MEVFLSHWHCIVPAVAMTIGALFMNRGKRKGETEIRTMNALRLGMNKEEQEHV